MKAKTFIASSILAASAVASSVAMAESNWSANIGVTSNYMWRGVTQTGDQAAIQGGIDYENPNGFYAGTWASNVTWTEPEGYELDLYAGYGFDWAKTSWDVGYIYYAYPLTSNESPSAEFPDGLSAADFGEVYLNFGWEWLGLGVAYTTNVTGKDPVSGTDFEDGHLYYFVSAEFEAGGVGYGAVIGKYDFDVYDDLDYTYGEVYLSKSDFTFSIAKNDAEDAAWGVGTDDPRVWVSWGKSFDL